jgi:hypothetical protein
VQVEVLINLLWSYHAAPCITMIQSVLRCEEIILYIKYLQLKSKFYVTTTQQGSTLLHVFFRSHISIVLHIVKSEDLRAFVSKL